MKYHDTCAIPDYAVCYIAYGDNSGIDENDELLINEFLSSLPESATFDYGSGESYFCNNPEFGPACNVVDTVIYIND